MGDVLREALDATVQAGADAAQARVLEVDGKELNVEWDVRSLLGSTFDRRLELVALVGGRRASLKVNDLSADAVARAAAEVVAAAEASSPDTANAIADAQPPAEFSSGP